MHPMEDAHEQVVKVALQAKRGLITANEMSAQFVRILIDLKIALGE